MIVADAPSAVSTLDLAAPPATAPSVPRAVAIGVFDGVHRGHRELLRRLRRAAHRCGAVPTVLTFYPHPRAVVGAGEAPPALCSLRRRVQLLEATGRVDECVVLAFTADVAGLAPEAFVQQVVVGRLAARHVLVGANFRFGRARAGDPTTLHALGERHGFAVEPVDLDALVAGREPAHVSSTLVRRRLADGDVAFARWALGRPHELDGRVMGAPGAAPVRPVVIEPAPGACVPRAGHYAGRVRWPCRSGTTTALTVGDDGTIAAWDVAEAPRAFAPVTVEFANTNGAP